MSNTPDTATINQLATAIAAGDLPEDDVRRLENAIKTRRRNERRSITVGTEVKVVGAIRPKYLIGQKATVVDKTRTRLVIRMNEGQRVGQDLTIPPQNVEAA